MKKINLGCGQSIKKDWVNIDIIDYGQEIIRDITKGLPFDDSSIDEIYSSHCLEHIERQDVRYVWEEIYRVLKPESIFSFELPHSAGKQLLEILLMVQ